MKKIKVNLKKDSYKVLIGKSGYSQLVDEIEKLKLNRNILFIIDANVEKYHEEYIRKEFKNYEGRILYYILKPGERSKSYLELNKIYSFLLKNGFGRDSLIIAIGGGVTGDLAGYAASTFMRGIQLIHIPTTLLAAVDSAIGGKTGINFEMMKNMIGTFYQPKLVLTDINFLKSLPERELLSGAGEVIKYAFLSNMDFFNYVNENLDKIFQLDEKILEEVILKSSSIKAAVVSQDEKESGLRKILNLGHTFAHAIESDLNFKLTHGEAVIAGIIAALYLSDKIKVLSKSDLRDYLSLPRNVKTMNGISLLNEVNMVNIMHLDKKSRSGKIKFVLLSGIGNILLDIEAGEKDVLYSIKKLKEFYS